MASTVLVSACGLGSANDDSAVVTVTEPVVAATVTPLADSWEEVDFENLPPALADRVWNAVGC